MRTSFVLVRPMVPLAAVHVKGPTTCVQQGVFTRKPVSRGDAGIGGPGALAPSSPSGAGGYVLAPSAPVALRGTAVSDGPAWVRTRRLTLGALRLCRAICSCGCARRHPSRGASASGSLCLCPAPPSPP